MMDQQKETKPHEALEPVIPQPGWDPIFLTRQNISKSTENLPYLAQIYASDDEEASDNEGSEVGETESEVELQTAADPTDRFAVEEEPIVRFMRDSLDSEYPELCTPQADTLEAICCGATLDRLVRGESGDGTVALLDDGRFVGDTFQRRVYENPGPLTAQGIYNYLSKKVRCREMIFYTHDVLTSNAISDFMNRNNRRLQLYHVFQHLAVTAWKQRFGKRKVLMRKIAA